MPLYDFRNKETGEIEEHFCKIAEKEQFLKDNAHLEAVYTTAGIQDPVRLGIRRIDSGFKEVLQKVHENTPGSALNRTTRI